MWCDDGEGDAENSDIDDLDASQATVSDDRTFDRCVVIVP